MIGSEDCSKKTPRDSWEKAAKESPYLSLIGISPKGEISVPPFVYEKIDAPQLEELRERDNLDKIIEGSPDEYSAMLRLGSWIGTLWDHGNSLVPGGTKNFRVAEVIEAGKKGAKFWCEIAAKVTVQAATALGWPARLVAASRDGYKYEHAVAELWSNQFDKWFVMDTDFNFVFEANGIPLSAFELCHQGPDLEKNGQLFTRKIAPSKPSINSVNLIPFYRYINIDLRNDWYTRRLSNGSPAGGDYATWWTARSSLGPLLTEKIRIDDENIFNWPVNITFIQLGDFKLIANSYVLIVRLSGYSPYFDHFLWSVDGGNWHQLESNEVTFPFSSGTHTIQARMMTEKKWSGPVSSVTFKLL